MQCVEARTFLPLLTLPVPGELPPELEATREHLRDCADCRLLWEHELIGEQALAARFRDVPVLANQSADLLEHFVAARLAIDSPTPATLRRRWRLTLAGAAVLLALCALLLFQTLPTATLETARLLAIIEQSSKPSAWPESARVERPAGWSALAQLMADPPRRHPQSPISLTMVSFTYRPPRSSESAMGVLWIADARRVADSQTLPGLESAQIDYGAGGTARLVWQERGLVFVLQVSADALRQLHDALKQSRSLA